MEATKFILKSVKFVKHPNYLSEKTKKLLSLYLKTGTEYDSFEVNNYKEFVNVWNEAGEGDSLVIIKWLWLDKVIIDISLSRYVNYGGIFIDNKLILLHSEGDLTSNDNDILWKYMELFEDMRKDVLRQLNSGERFLENYFNEFTLKEDKWFKPSEMNKKQRKLWSNFLKAEDRTLEEYLSDHSDEPIHYRVWSWKHGDETSIIDDMYSSPGDNEHGVIFIDNKLNYINADQSLERVEYNEGINLNFIHRIPAFRQLRLHQKI